MRISAEHYFITQSNPRAIENLDLAELQVSVVSFNIKVD